MDEINGFKATCVGDPLFVPKALEENMSELTNQKGFNLIELLVAMAILLIGTLAVASMLMTSSMNSIASNQDRGADSIAVQLVEAIRGEVAQMTMSDLGLDGSGGCSLRLQKPVPGASVGSGPYEYQDSNTFTSGTAVTKLFVQRVGKYFVGKAGGTNTSTAGTSYIYKWKISDVQDDYSLPDGTLKLEVSVGWNDRKYGSDDCRYPCGNQSCSGYTGDPGDPGAANRTCARCTKMTSWVIHAKN